MRKLSVFMIMLVVLFVMEPFAAVQNGTMVDSRDKRKYKTVTIGEHTWMAENLNYKAKDSYCYDNKPVNCTKYGRLYTWTTAMNLPDKYLETSARDSIRRIHKGLCPIGWHIPNLSEFELLLKNIGGDYLTAGKKLKSRNGWDERVLTGAIAFPGSDWNSNGNGTDDFLFSALPAGRNEYSYGFKTGGNNTFFWTSTENEDASYDAWQMMLYRSSEAHLSPYGMKKYGASVRCVKDQEVEDKRDGNKYKTVKIGNQIWMAENLNYKTENSFCYENKPGNCKKYGRLYSWDAAIDACPTGWRLPSDVDFAELWNAVQGTPMKLLSVDGWGKMKGEDVFGFSAFPAGNKGLDGDYYDFGRNSFIWSSTESDDDYALGLLLNSNYNEAGLNSYYKTKGFSVRCLKGEPPNKFSVISGSKDEYLTDSRDGKKYKIVKIGNQTWMAENLNYDTKGSFCNGEKPGNCEKYGRLYTWNGAKNACPAEWHLPSGEEIYALMNAVGDYSNAGKVLKSTSGWYKGGNGIDAYGFSAEPSSGKAYVGKFYDYYGSASYWSSTETDRDSAIFVLMLYSDDTLNMRSMAKESGFSVRCLKDEFVTDSRDGKKYRIVNIGDQTWMAENLNYEMEDSYCYNDHSSNCNKYGRLYTYIDAKMACPDGWHLPSKKEWETLIDAVGDPLLAGSVLKSTSYWGENNNSSDGYMFSALPAGFRHLGGYYSYKGSVAFFWSSTENGSLQGHYIYLNNDDDKASFDKNYKDNGYSVRCVQDDEPEFFDNRNLPELELNRIESASKNVNRQLKYWRDNSMLGNWEYGTLTVKEWKDRLATGKSKWTKQDEKFSYVASFSDINYLENKGVFKGSESIRITFREEFAGCPAGTTYEVIYSAYSKDGISFDRSAPLSGLASVEDRIYTPKLRNDRKKRRIERANCYQFISIGEEYAKISQSTPREETLYLSGQQWGAPATFNPLAESWMAAWPVGGRFNLVYEPLIVYNTLNGQIEPLLGTLVEDLSNNDSVVVDLNPAAKWSDGKQVNSNDVKFIFTKGSINTSEQISAIHVDTIATEPAVQERLSFIVNKAQRNNPLSVRDLLQAIRIAPAHVFEPLIRRKGLDEVKKLVMDKNPVVSGPYNIMSANPNQIILQRRDDYWGNTALHGGKMPVPKFIVHPIYGSNGQLTNEMKEGNLDVSMSFMGDVWNLKRKGIYTWYDDSPYYAPGAMHMLVINTMKEPLNDKRFRRALATAIDYNAIRLFSVNNYTSQIQPGLIMPTSIEGKFINNEDVKKYGVDLGIIDKDERVNMVKKMLSEAGYNSVYMKDGSLDYMENAQGERLPTLYITSPAGWTDWELLVYVAVDGLREAGFDVREKLVDGAQYWPSLGVGNFDLIMHKPQADISPSLPWSRFNEVMSSRDWQPIGTYAGYNIGRYNQPGTEDYRPEVDALLAAIPLMSDSTEIEEAYRELNRIFMEDQPAIPLAYVPECYYEYSDNVWTNWPNAENPYAPPQVPGLGAGTNILWNIKLKRNQ